MLKRARPPSLALAGAANARGFTLIELAITLTLVGLLLALGLPSFMTWIRNSQVRTVADALQTGVRTAQAEAIRRNRQVVMTFTDAAPALDVAATTNGRNWSLQTFTTFPGETAEYLRGGALSDVASGVAIAATQNGNLINAICFNSSGRLATNLNATGGGAVAVCNAADTTFAVSQTRSDRPLSIVVRIGGQLRMCDPNRPALSASSPDGC